jgi:carbon-monoxide dehydrogenase small subunit
MEISLTINGRSHTCAVEDRTSLADFVRDRCHLTGTHLACEHGVCGACTVNVDGRPVRSCITLAAAVSGRRVHTIEGFDDDPTMAVLRECFHEAHALQCGFCTPGMLVTARDIVLRGFKCYEARIRLALAGNICRCTGYGGIVSAVMAAITRLGGARDHPEAVTHDVTPTGP